MRDGFIFYASFYEAIEQLTDEDRLAAYDMISRYALTGEIPEGATGAGYAIFLMAKPQIDANEQRRVNGSKGGRPKTEAEPNENQTITETKPKHNQTITETEPKEKDKEKEKEKEKSTLTSAKKEKHTHGEYKHVRLTDDEYQKLAEEYGQQRTDDAITFLDEYIEEKKYKSQSHYLAMRRWVYDALDERKPKERGPTNSQPRLSLGKFGNFQPRSHTEQAEQFNALRAAGVL